MNQNINLKSSEGFNLSANILLPNSKEKVPFVILCHGFTSSKKCSVIKILRESLLNLGIGSLAFDFLGHGESGGQISDFTAGKCVTDLKIIFDYIKPYEEIDFDRVGFFGRSLGGNIVLRYVVNNKKIKCVALNAPVSDLPDQLKNIPDETLKKWKNEVYASGFFGRNSINVCYDFYDDLVSNDIYEISKNIQCDVLIVHGDADETVSIVQSKKLKDSIGSKVILEIVGGADHRFELPLEFEKSISVTIKFFKDKLL